MEATALNRAEQAGEHMYTHNNSVIYRLLIWPASPNTDPKRQVFGRVATGLSILKSLVCLEMEKDPQRKRESTAGLPLSRRTP